MVIYADVLNRVPVSGPTPISNIFSGAINNWGDIVGDAENLPITVYARSDKAGTTEVLSKFLWLSESEIIGNGVAGENKMIEAIKQDKTAIGYCNYIYTFDPVSKQFVDNISIVPLDINHNGRLDLKEDFYSDFAGLQRAMWLGKYPCILNRKLLLVAAKKPATSELVDFLQWIFTDGQKTLKNMGYMELRTSEIKYCLAYLGDL